MEEHLQFADWKTDYYENIYPAQNNSSQGNAYKNSMVCFCCNRKILPQRHCLNHKWSHIAEIILKRKNKVGVITAFLFQNL